MKHQKYGLSFLFGLFCAFQVTGATEVIFQDNFSSRLGDGWAWIREDRAHWRVGDHGLEVRVQPGNMWGGANNAKNVLVRSVPDPAQAPMAISVTLSNLPTGQWEQVDLAWFYDDGNMVKLGQELVSGKLCVVMGREENDKARTVGIVPLDAYQVELRLLVTGKRIHGQYRTANWPDWREVGDCDLPIKGSPKVSLQFYQGLPDVEHWARIQQLTIQRLMVLPTTLEDKRLKEKVWKTGDAPPNEPQLLQTDNACLQLENIVRKPDQPGGKADVEQRVFTNRDGTYGWAWDRRALATEQPNFAGVAMNSFPTPERGGLQLPMALPEIKSLVAEMNIVSRLDVDRGQHNLCLKMLLSDSASSKQGKQHMVSIWLDWQGKDASESTLTDGFRKYGYAPGAPAMIQEVAQHVYRIQGLRGAPPRINLKTFLDDIAARLQWDAQTLQVWGLAVGNESWNNSKGRTVVHQLDFVLNGKRVGRANNPSP